MGKRSKHVYNGGNLTLGGLPTLKLCDGRSCKMHSGLLLSTRHGTMGHGDTQRQWSVVPTELQGKDKQVTR